MTNNNKPSGDQKMAVRWLFAPALVIGFILIGCEQPTNSDVSPAQWPSSFTGPTGSQLWMKEDDSKAVRFYTPEAGGVAYSTWNNGAKLDAVSGDTYTITTPNVISLALSFKAVVSTDGSELTISECSGGYDMSLGRPEYNALFTSFNGTYARRESDPVEWPQGFMEGSWRMIDGEIESAVVFAKREMGGIASYWSDHICDPRLIGVFGNTYIVTGESGTTSSFKAVLSEDGGTLFVSDKKADGVDFPPLFSELGTWPDNFRDYDISGIYTIGELPPPRPPVNVGTVPLPR